MVIFHRNRNYDVPAPEPKSHESIIRVLKIALFPTPAESSAHRFLFSNPLRKMFFFLLREGFSLTWKKTTSALLQRKLHLTRRVVLAFGLLSDNRGHCLAVGPQYCPHSEYLIFEKKCCMEVSEERNIQADYNTLLNFFQKYPTILNTLYNYSSYSGISLDFSLQNILNGELYVDNLNRSGSIQCFETLSFNKPHSRESTKLKQSYHNKRSCLFLIGAGAYANAYILPALTSHKNIHPHTIVDLNPALASITGKKFKFKHVYMDYQKALESMLECSDPLCVIATYHSTHVDIAEMAVRLNSKARLFMEKPPATTRSELDRLLQLRIGGAFIEIGYNRRYAPFVQKAYKIISEGKGPIVMTCLVKELSIPQTHWYYWPTQGTRITGNLCHWIDLAFFFIHSNPIHVTVNSPVGNCPGDEVSIFVEFQNGSRLTLMATEKGDRLRGVQEYIDIRRDDLTVVIDDFMKMIVSKKGRQRVYRKLIRDKGHRRMYEQFIRNSLDKKNPLYPDLDLATTTSLYLSISEMVKKGETSRLLE